MTLASLDRARFVGVWRLVSLRETSFGDEPRDSAEFGSGPAGTIVYTDSGHVSVSFMNPSRAAWLREHEPTDGERAAAARGYSGYAGRFTVNAGESLVLHHVETALVPNRVGTTMTRAYAFDGSRLVLRTPRFVRGDSGVERVLVWERLA